MTSGEGLSALLTYEPYYGLREKPFSLSADPRFLFNGPSHVRAFEQLLAGIKRREGLIVLSGEIGTGKTTLCRGVLGALDRRTFTTFVRDPFLSREDLLKTLLIDFGVMSIEDLKSGRLNGATRPDLSYPLYEFLDSLVPLQAFAVLIIDEAQNLSPSLLEEIRILSELEAREKLLQVVLVGQPELRSSLKLPQLRQVDQRVSVRCELAPLPAEEVSLYIAHRLGVASVGAPAVEFTPEAARLVWRASGGVPRVINLMCDRALHRGFLARAHTIDAAIVFGAVEDLGRVVEPPPVVNVESSPVPLVQEVPAAVLVAPVPREAGPYDNMAARPRDEGPAAGFHPRAARYGGEVAGAPALKDAKRHEDLASSGHEPGPVGAGRDESVPANVGRDQRPAAAPREDTAGDPPEERKDESTSRTEVPPYAQGEFADPLAEFSHEADLVRSRRPGRAAALAAAVILLAGSAGTAVWYTQLRTPQAPAPAAASVQRPSATAAPSAPRPDAPTPAAPSPVVEMPAGNESRALDRGAYVIQVASFQSRARAQTLVDELMSAGYRTEEIVVDLGPRGIWRQVLVGRYPTAADAEADLAGIRERPSYADARIVALSAE